jgi:hypothetical protein
MSPGSIDHWPLVKSCPTLERAMVQTAGTGEGGHGEGFEEGQHNRLPMAYPNPHCPTAATFSIPGLALATS